MGIKKLLIRITKNILNSQLPYTSGIFLLEMFILRIADDVDMRESAACCTGSATAFSLLNLPPLPGKKDKSELDVMEIWSTYCILRSYGLPVGQWCATLRRLWRWIYCIYITASSTPLAFSLSGTFGKAAIDGIFGKAYCKQIA